MIKKAESDKKVKKDSKECSCKGKILIEKSKKVIEHCKQYIANNYKTPKFIAITLLILLALIGISTHKETTVKYHFLKRNIVKEVIADGHSTYFFCSKDLGDESNSEDGFYITCNKQLIEN